MKPTHPGKDFTGRRSGRKLTQEAWADTGNDNKFGVYLAEAPPGPKYGPSEPAPPQNTPCLLDQEEDDSEEDEEGRQSRSNSKKKPTTEKLHDDDNSEMEREKYDNDKAQEVMYSTPFFRDFEQAMPGLIDSLSSVAMEQFAESGDVLFRQGDPAVDFYTIVKGDVGVYVHQLEEQKSPRDFTKESATQNRFQMSCCRCRKRRKGVRMAGADRYLTCEGHNTWSETSEIGDRFATLRVNQIFGGLGLLKDQPRSATIKCLRPCKFLVIQNSDFKNMFLGKLLRHTESKYGFFRDHVPGFESCKAQYSISRVVTEGTIQMKIAPHPSDPIERVEVRQGHKFLSEGRHSPPICCVIIDGSVNFWRNTYALPQMRPGFVIDGWSDGSKPWKKQIKQPQLMYGRSWQVLSRGQLFTSLSFFGLHFAEPFTAEVASEKCSFYTITEGDIDKLPPHILSAFKVGSYDAMKSLLGLSPAFMSCFSVPSQLQEYQEYDIEEVV